MRHYCKFHFLAANNLLSLDQLLGFKSTIGMKKQETSKVQFGKQCIYRSCSDSTKIQLILIGNKIQQILRVICNTVLKTVKLTFALSILSDCYSKGSYISKVLHRPASFV